MTPNVQRPPVTDARQSSSQANHRRLSRPMRKAAHVDLARLLCEEKRPRNNPADAPSIRRKPTSNSEKQSHSPKPVQRGAEGTTRPARRCSSRKTKLSYGATTDTPSVSVEWCAMQANVRTSRRPQRLGQSCKERLFLWLHRLDPRNPLARAGTVGAIGARLASRPAENVDTRLAKSPPTLGAANARLCSLVIEARESSVR